MDHAKILIDEALKDSGWQSNFAFPVASDENKYLINLLGEVFVKIRLLQEDVEEYREKNNKLRTHLALVQHERSMTESLLLERQRECDTMRHELYLAEREIGRTRQDLGQLKTKRKEIGARIGSLENEIFVKSNELSSIKTLMDYDQNLIDVYLDACEEDIGLRERLTALKHVDESRLALLNSEAGRLSEKRRDVRRKLDTVVSKNGELRLRVGAAADKCRQENQARRDLLHVWETCIAQLMKRDEDYTLLGQEYDKALEQIKEQTLRVESTKKMSGLIQDDIKTTEKQLTQTNREIWNTRLELQRLNEEVQSTADELETLQKTLERTDQDFRSTKVKNKQLKLTVNSFHENLSKLLQRIEELEQRFAEVQDKRLNEEQLAKMAEEELATNERCQKQAYDYSQQLTNLSLKAFDNLNRAAHEAGVLEAELSGAVTSLRGLKKHTDQREVELIKLDELIYKAQLFSQRLEQRISKLEADPLLSQEELTMKNQQIASLQNELDVRNKSCTTLSSMINQFMNDKRICKMRSQKLQVLMEQLQTQLDTAQLTMNNTKLALMKQEVARREMLVECNLNKHQVKRMEARLNLLRNKVMSEEAKQLQLESLEHEMDLELNAQKTKVGMNVRQTEARLAEARAELTTRERRLEQIKARYGITVTSSSDNSGDALGARMRYLIETLQERQDLRQKGNTLDAEVRRAEEELRALENTVLVMSSLNEAARGKVLLRSTEEPLVEERKQLEGELAESQSQLTDQRNSRRKLRGDIMHCEGQLEEINSVLAVIRDQYRNAETQLSKASRAVEENKQRYERANRMLNQILERLNRFYQANQPDIEMRLLRDFNRLIYVWYERCLRKLATENEDILLVESQLADQFNYHKPTFSVRHSQLARMSKRAAGTNHPSSSTRPVTQGLPVVSIGEHLNPKQKTKPKQPEESAKHG
ncbi:hypothetical protein CRM22_002664 [Opisthorchis felineus]|uniref:Coiled-coil domain-containing protein 39 n=1 Tax=Opisthorchis felineus TaxID=147828 RepID=A0A4S2M9G7_OPIFE|nr:hypothetical protein CRM22_002664 [Opisthorchis felineus]